MKEIRPKPTAMKSRLDIDFGRTEREIKTEVVFISAAVFVGAYIIVYALVMVLANPLKVLMIGK